MKDWKHLEARQKYIAAVVDKLKAEGTTVVPIADVERILRDAFKVEANDDLTANYYLITANKEYKIEGPLPFDEACNRASAMADSHQCDVSILQDFDTFYFIDY